ncbi:MAG: hypothetical protein LBJ02_11690 [Bifidobacteriaceae bacterium]|nr:hypothetical protein [Bifidobacteriaceae bacterium]
MRSDTVGAILAEVFVRPDLEFTIAELARRADALPATAHREVTRLVQAGVLVDRREGNNRLVRVNQAHPLYSPMSEVIAAAYGPVPVLRDLLAGAPGVVEAFIYGSWAERRSGRLGAFPRDVDVMVVGDLAVDTLIEIQDSARGRLGLDVSVYRVTPDEWRARSGNPFLAEVTSRPTVALQGGKDAGGLGSE